MPQHVPSLALALGCLALASCGRSLETDADPAAGGAAGSVSTVGPGTGPGSAQGGADATGPAGPTSGQGGDGTSAGGGDDPTGAGGAPNGPAGPGPGPGSGAGGDGAGTPVGPGSGAGGEGAGSGAGGAPPGCPGFGDPCSTCVADLCSDRWCACLDNPECLAVFACTDDCSTEACRQACYAEHSAGVGDAGLVVDCAADACPAACPGADELPDCTECLYTSCVAEAAACYGEPECLSLYGCLDGCAFSDLSCQADCYDEHEDGIEPLQDLLECSEVECPETCG